MDHELMTMWLSVDPMADKYPSISPYAYCAWNPVKLVDPDGRELFLIGNKDCIQKALKIMGKCSRNLSFSIGEDGKISYTGKAKTRREKKMVEVLNSKDVTVNIEVQNNDKIEGEKSLINEGGGVFMGNELNSDKSHASTRQVINVNSIEKFDDLTSGDGTLMWHEIIESYKGGVNSIKSGMSAGNALEDSKAYRKAHKQASRLFPGTIVKTPCTTTQSKWVIENGQHHLKTDIVQIPNCFTYSLKR